MTQTATNGEEQDPRWRRVHEAGRRQADAASLGEEMLKPQEKRILVVPAAGQEARCRWPTDGLLRQLLGMERAFGAMDRLTSSQFEEFRGAMVAVAEDLLWDGNEAVRIALRGEYGFDTARSIIAGVFDAYQGGLKAVATFR